MTELYGSAAGPQRICPWHPDTNPSLSVNAAKGYFYCHGCHISGDVFTLVELKESLSFHDAVAYLAQRAKLPAYRALPGDVAAADAARDADLITERVAGYYTERLAGADDAQQYLIETRGIPQDFLAPYALGWADGGAASWVEATYGAAWLPILHAAGLADPATNQYHPDAPAYRDRFFERITFPCLRRGRTVFLSGRTTDPTVEPKYLHQRGREAPLYPEDDGLPADRVYLVEGPLDALSLRVWGYPAYALQGGMRAGAIRRLRGTRELYACFDGDRAGRETALRLAGAIGIDRVKIVALPEGSDPNDLLRKGARAAFDAAVTAPYDPLAYALRDVAVPLDVNGAAEWERVYQLLAAQGELYAEVALETQLRPRFKLTKFQVEAVRKEVARHRMKAQVQCPSCGTILRGT